MNIDSMTSFGDVDTVKYLDSTKLIENNDYECVAFVVNSTSGITKRESGYFTFYLKSVDNTILTAQLFDVENFVKSGFNAKYLMHKPVIVKFTAQIYYGRWSLILRDIKLWEGDFNRSLFLGKLTVDTSEILRWSHKTGVLVPINEWECTSFAELADGNAGAFAVLAGATLNHLEAYNNLWGIDYIALSEIALCTLKALFNHYKLKEEFPVVLRSKLLDILTRSNLENDKSPNSAVINDACASILGLGTPQHLYSNLVCRSIMNTIKDMKLIYLYKSMPLGAGTTTFDGIELVKY